MILPKIITTVIAFSNLLAALAQEPQLMTPVGHSQPIKSVNFSPDGRMLITASEDKTVKIWDTQTGVLLKNIHALPGWPSSACFSPDGKSILIGLVETDPQMGVYYTASRVLVIDLYSGSTRMTLKGHRENIAAVKYSPDGKRMVSAGGDGVGILWDALSGDSLFSFRHGDWIKAVSFSSDGKKILSASRDKTAAIWDVKTGMRLALLKGHRNVVVSAEFNRANTRVVTASLDSTVIIWDVATGEAIFTLRGHRAGCQTASFSSDEKWIISAGNDNIPRIWDAETGRMVHKLYDENKWIPNPADYPDGQDIVHAKFTGDSKSVLCSAFDGYFRKWDVATGKMTNKVSGHNNYISAILFSPDGRLVLTSSNDLTCRIWSAKNLDSIQQLKGQFSNAESGSFSPDGNYLLTASSYEARLWEVTSCRLVKTFSGNLSLIKFAVFSPNGQFVATAALDGIVSLYDVASGAPVFRVNTNSEAEIRSLCFSPDGRFLAVLCPPEVKLPVISFEKGRPEWQAEEKLHGVKVYQVSDGKLIHSQQWKSLLTSIFIDKQGTLYLAGGTVEGNEPVLELARTAVFSADEKTVLIASLTNKMAYCMDAATGRRFPIFTGHEAELTSAVFSPDERFVLTASLDKTARLWNAKTGALIRIFSGHTNVLTSARFNADGTKLVTAATDNVFKLWETATGKLLYTLAAVDSNDYFFQEARGYYLSSKNAAKKLHFVTPELKRISFDQLDVKYNRPDKVLESAGNTDTALTRAYYLAWKKRMRKLGIDTMQFQQRYSIPVLTIKNRAQISHSQSTGKLVLKIEAEDEKQKLRRFNIWVNEVPVYGKSGIDIRSIAGQRYSTSVTLELSSGKNTIEASVTNSNGMESYRIPLEVNYTPSVPPVSRVYFIGIGVEQYRQEEYNLKYSVKDIRDLAKKLREKYGNAITIDTLFNQHLSKANLHTLKAKLDKLTVNDKVIVAYSGHGLLSKSYDYFLATWATNFDKPEQGGLPYEALEELLDGILPRKKLLLIDACHSGEVDKEELLRMEKIIDSLHLKRGIKPVAYKNNGANGTANSFELMQHAFIDLSKNTGASIIGASAGTQFAYERNELENGVFTYCILEAMEKNPSMKLSAFRAWVGQRVVQLTNGLQKPTSRAENSSTDWQIW